MSYIGAGDRDQASFFWRCLMTRLSPEAPAGIIRRAACGARWLEIRAAASAKRSMGQRAYNVLRPVNLIGASALRGRFA